MFLLSLAHGGGVAGDFNQMLLLGRIYDAGGKKIFLIQGLPAGEGYPCFGVSKGMLSMMNEYIW